MVLLELFVSFVKIGFTSFGGMSMVPLIMQEMESHGWMTAEDLSNLIAIAEMTPGPLGVNCATFAGNQAAGPLGGVAAVAGVLMPAYTLTLCAAMFYVKFRSSSIMSGILSVVRPVCIALILDVVITLILTNYFVGSHVDCMAVAIGILMLFLIVKRKWSVPRVIISAAVIGMVGYGVFQIP